MGENIIGVLFFSIGIIASIFLILLAILKFIKKANKAYVVVKRIFFTLSILFVSLFLSLISISVFQRYFRTQQSSNIENLETFYGAVGTGF